MFHILLIILLSIDLSITNNPILIASPYPFNTSESSNIKCFSNDNGIILSLTIIARVLDNDKNISSLEYRKTNITKNESIILTIPSKFNYSQLYPKIECHSKYYHGHQKSSQLEVLSIVEILQKEYFSINTYPKQMININCLTYGTNVSIHWDFSKDTSNDTFGPLPIGIRIHHKFILNDTLIIDHVSYSDHHGYYRCYATNEIFNITYEDKSIIYLNVQKNHIWIPILIICIIIGICILILILCSIYCKKKRKNQSEIKDISQENNQIIPSDRESIKFSSDFNQKTIEQLNIQEENIHTDLRNKNSIKSQISLISTQKEQEQISIVNSTFSQFVLGSPFVDSSVQPFNSVKFK